MKWQGETQQQWIDRVVDNWTRCFALFPTQMTDGTWVWLENYEVMYGRALSGEVGACGIRCVGSEWEPYV